MSYQYLCKSRPSRKFAHEEGVCAECYRLTVNVWKIYFEVDLTDPYIGLSILHCLKAKLEI